MECGECKCFRKTGEFWGICDFPLSPLWEMHVASDDRACKRMSKHVKKERYANSNH